MSNVIRQNCSFYPEDYAAVMQFAKDWGLTFSGGLRLVIREWKQLKQEQLATARDVDGKQVGEPKLLLG